MSSIAGQRGWVGQWAGLIEPPKLGGWLRAWHMYTMQLHSFKWCIHMHVHVCMYMTLYMHIPEAPKGNVSVLLLFVCVCITVCICASCMQIYVWIFHMHMCTHTVCMYSCLPISLCSLQASVLTSEGHTQSSSHPSSKTIVSSPNYPHTMHSPALWE